MYKRSEGFFRSHQDAQLFFQAWENPQAKGTVIITHGQGEHSESYHRLTQAFENDQWSFYAWDLIGHGRSDGRRGFVSDFDEYCKDMRLFLDLIMNDEKIKKGPVVLFCHSMGGLIQLQTLLKNPQLDYTAMVVSSPLLGLSVPVPTLKAKGAVLLNKVLPQLTLGNEISNGMLTRDVDVIREYEMDPLRHDRISSGAFLGFLEAFDFVRPRAKELKKPALFLLPGNDPVTSTPDAKRFFEDLGSERKELFVYPESKHELINDINRKTVFSDLKKFLDSLLENK